MKNKWGYIILIVILIIFIGISSFFLYSFYDISKSAIGLREVVYKENSEIVPNVILKKDEYYQENEAKDIYITDFIDKIQSAFAYTLTFSSHIKGEYNYQIMGSLKASKTDSKEEILSKYLEKQEKKKFTVDGNVININDDFTIDFNKYLAEYRQFKDTANIDLAGYINFQVTINYNVYNEDIAKYITGNKNLNIVIPLDNTTTKLEITPKKEETKSAFSEPTNKEKRLYTIIYIEFIEAIILFILLIIIIIKKIVHQDTLYEATLKDLMKDYGEVLVEVTKIPDLTKYEVLFITNFNDLVDTQNELRIPIIYKEVIKDHETVFMILHEDKAYVYKLCDEVGRRQK